MQLKGPDQLQIQMHQRQQELRPRFHQMRIFTKLAGLDADKGDCAHHSKGGVLIIACANKLYIQSIVE